MATLRSDIIIPEVFTPYVIEQTTQRDAFLASGVVQPMAELNASEDGGDFVQVPFYKANLSGDFERLTDSSSLTPGKIEADKQVGVLFCTVAVLSSPVIWLLWLPVLTRWLRSATRLLTTSPTSVRRIFCPAWPVCSVLWATPALLLMQAWLLMARLATPRLN